MVRRVQPKTADELVRQRRPGNKAILGVIVGLVVLFFVLTIARMGGG